MVASHKVNLVHIFQNPTLKRRVGYDYFIMNILRHGGLILFFLQNYKVKVEDNIKYQGFPSSNNSHIATYYAGLRKSPKNREQPQLLIGLNRLDLENGKVFGKASTHGTLVTNFADVKLGSIWKNAYLQKRIITPPLTFEVNHNEDGWRIWSFLDLEKKGVLPELIKDNIHNLKDSYALVFKTHFPDRTNGPLLIIPCLNYFLSIFGHSNEFKRVLCTYPWEEIYERFELGFSSSKRAIMHPRGGFTEGDYKALASAKYSQVARNSFKSFAAQIQIAKPEKRISPIVKPWFDGDISMTVTGCYTHEKCIYVWHINKFTSPDIEDFDTYKEKSVRAPEYKRKQSDVELSSYALEASRKARKDQVRCDSASPSHDSHDYYTDNTYTSDAGYTPAIKKIYIEKEKLNKGIQKPAEDQSKLASGEKQGTDTGIGRLITSNHIDSLPLNFPVSGAVEDIWLYLYQSSNDKNNKIRNACWQNSVGQMSTEKSIEYVQLEKLDPITDYHQSYKYIKDNAISHIKKSIIWLNLTRENRDRGSVLIQFDIDGKRVFIFEIEREFIPTKKEPKMLKEVGPKGLVFTLHDNKNIDQIRSMLTDEIRFAHRFSETLLSQLYKYGNFKTLKHVRTKSNGYGKNFVDNALSKLNITTTKA